MSILYVVATPIGNLKDISLRALEVLRQVDLILCEDTRVTQKLLTHFGIKTPTLSYHQHSKLNKINYIIGLLKQGKDLALVPDAGTPGISDPGGKLIAEILKLPNTPYQSHGRITAYSEVKIVPIPGPSALTAAVSVCGFPMDRFLFLGFPPAKKKRKKFFEEIVNSKYSVIFYESPHRLVRTLEDLQNVYTPYQSHGRITAYPSEIVVCRELTKKFETIYRGTINQVISQIEKDPLKGEFVVIVAKK